MDTLNKSSALVTSPEYVPLGEQVLIVQFAQEVSVEVNAQVHALAARIKGMHIRGIKQLFPAFCSLAVSYDPVVILYNELVERLQAINDSTNGQQNAPLKSMLKEQSKVIPIPVVYGGDYGPDLEYVADHTGLSAEEVVSIHHSTSYLIYMLGFTTSLPYCGDVDSRLLIPRRATPRLNIVQGSVAIANRQTIIYPVSSPGGWHVIGRTPIRLFNPHIDPPTALMAGYYVKFEPISAREAECWSEDKQREWNERW